MWEEVRCVQGSVSVWTNKRHTHRYSAPRWPPITSLLSFSALFFLTTRTIHIAPETVSLIPSNFYWCSKKFDDYWEKLKTLSLSLWSFNIPRPTGHLRRHQGWITSELLCAYSHRDRDFGCHDGSWYGNLQYTVNIMSNAPLTHFMVLIISSSQNVPSTI